MAVPSPAWRPGSDAVFMAGQRHLNAFLRESRAQLAALLPSPADADADASGLPSPAPSSPPVVHVVLGNEAADADSIVSALVLAFAKRHLGHPGVHAAASLGPDAPSSVVFVPLVPVPRADLALRADVVALFQALGVDEAALLFVDEFPWTHARIRGRQVRLRTTLVDHNALRNKLVAGDGRAAAAAAVAEILDHHEDSGEHAGADPRDVAFADGRALVASNCTLVAERILAALDASADASGDASGDASADASADENADDVRTRFSVAATMLLGVMALDSVGFNPLAHKVTARDEAAAARLEPLALADRSALFSWLQAARTDPGQWDRLPLADCLRSDYKEFGFPAAGDDRTYGVSSVLLPLEALVRKAADGRALGDELARFCAANALRFLVVMAIFGAEGGARERQLLLYSPPGEDAAVPRQCAAFLREERTLGLEPLELPPTHASDAVAAFGQRNAAASRKQVVPLLQRSLARR